MNDDEIMQDVKKLIAQELLGVVFVKEEGFALPKIVSAGQIEDIREKVSIVESLFNEDPQYKAAIFKNYLNTYKNTKDYFSKAGKDILAIFEKSPFWENSKVHFYVKTSLFMAYIQGNEQLFIEMLNDMTAKDNNFIDSMLQDLEDTSNTDKESTLFGFLALFTGIVSINKKGAGSRKSKSTALSKEIKEEYKNIKLNALSNYLMPIDKVNDHITKIDSSKKKLQRFEIDVGKNKKQNAKVLFSIDYSELAKICPEVNRLPEFEKTVMNVIGSICYENGGDTVTTVGQIAKALRVTTNPEFNKKIADSIQHMTPIQITLDNESAAKKLGYDRLIYKGSMLPIERVTAIVNGQVVEDAVHVFRTPPLVEYALKCGQIITIPAELYKKLPGGNSKHGLAVKNYLLRRLKSKTSIKYNEILLETLFKECGITDRRAKYDIKKTIKSILDVLQGLDEIPGYKIADDRIIISKEASAITESKAAKKK